MKNTMNKYFILFFLLCQNVSGQYSTLAESYDIRSAASGRAGVAQHTPENFVNNPAHLALINDCRIYVHWLGHYFVSGISAIQMQAALPELNIGKFGISISSDGGSAYRESTLGASYARRISQNGTLGIGFHSYFQQFPESGHNFGLFPVVGIQWQPIPRLCIATNMINPISLNIGSLAVVPSVARFGISYRIDQQIQWVSEVQISEWKNRQLRMGLSYKPHEHLVISTGYISGGQFTLGVGLIADHLHISIACQLHQVLGPNAGIGLLWILRGKAT